MPQDLWHLTRPPAGATPCGEHGQLVASERHGRGRRWRAHYTDPSGAPAPARSFAKKTDAEAFELKMRSDVVRGEYVDPTAGKVTFADFAQEWRTSQVHADSTVLQVENHFRLHVLPELGPKELRAIRPSAIQGLVKKMSLVLAPATVEVVYRYVSACFKAAVLDGLIPRSPCVNVNLPEIERKRIVPLPKVLVDDLREAMRPVYRALVDVGSMAGLRQGEAFGLEVRHVDFLRRTVRVEQQLKLLSGQPPFLAPPKSAASYRTVPVGQTLIDRLAAHLAEFPAVETEIVDKTGARPVTRRARLIFLSRNGQPLRRNNYDESVWNRARERVSGVLLGRVGHCEDDEILRQWAAQVAECTFHDGRHFYASALIAHGASVTQVQARLGHATAQETLNTYSHLWPDEDDRTRAIIDAVFAGAESPRLRSVSQ